MIAWFSRLSGLFEKAPQMVRPRAGDRSRRAGEKLSS